MPQNLLLHILAYHSSFQSRIRAIRKDKYLMDSIWLARFRAVRCVLRSSKLLRRHKLLVRRGVGSGPYARGQGQEKKKRKKNFQTKEADWKHDCPWLSVQLPRYGSFLGRKFVLYSTCIFPTVRLYNITMASISGLIASDLSWIEHSCSS